MTSGMLSSVLGRRSLSNCCYNPLAGSLLDASPDTWVCTAEHGALFYATQDCEGLPEKGLVLGGHVEATKEGDLLREKSTGLYAAFLDRDGRRVFKNQRLLMLEKTAVERQDDGLLRRKSSIVETLARGVSGGSAGGGVGATLLGRRRADTGGPLLRGESSKGGESQRRSSFRWVDATGESHRLEGSSDDLQDVTHRPEVWICVADHDVPFRNSPSLTDYAEFGLDCSVGQKVNAVREDGWLRVFEVRSSLDAAAVIGRRSFSAAKRLTVEETGLYLPLSDGGHPLFKNQRLLALCESARGEAPVCSKRLMANAM